MHLRSLNGVKYIVLFKLLVKSILCHFSAIHLIRSKIRLVQERIKGLKMYFRTNERNLPRRPVKMLSIHCERSNDVSYMSKGSILNKCYINTVKQLQFGHSDMSKGKLPLVGVCELSFYANIFKSMKAILCSLVNILFMKAKQ